MKLKMLVLITIVAAPYSAHGDSEIDSFRLEAISAELLALPGHPVFQTAGVVLRCRNIQPCQGHWIGGTTFYTTRWQCRLEGEERTYFSGNETGRGFSCEGSVGDAEKHFATKLTASIDEDVSRGLMHQSLDQLQHTVDRIQVTAIRQQERLSSAHRRQINGVKETLRRFGSEIEQ